MTRLRKAPAAEGTIRVEVERGGIGRGEGGVGGGAEWELLLLCCANNACRISDAPRFHSISALIGIMTWNWVNEC